MTISSTPIETSPALLQKAPTGIAGLDEITYGGFPQGRPTLVCGAAGCGKTLLALEFLIQGAIQYGEPGVFLAFEETPEDIAKNLASLGFDLAKLEAEEKLLVDYIHVDRSQIAVAGDYDLEALFIRLQSDVESIGAKRVAIDTLETIFSGFDNQGLLRQEIRRLFRWLKDRRLTTVITGERGEGSLTRHGLEEYVSDCVILLDHRVENQISTRRIRVLKYRGSKHGTNEYPFLIDEQGLSVLPISSLSLDHQVSDERISTGIARLDGMLEGKGYYRGSSILVSGTAGSGKTSLAASLAEATCRRGERCLYLAFEESPAQIMRNMRSIGLNLKERVDQDLLRFHSSRPTVHGLEMHLVKIHNLVNEFNPSVIIVDPVSNLTSIASATETNSMLVRLIDFLKLKGITAFFTHLASGSERESEATDVGISSIIDTWLLVRDIELNGERNRGIYVLKSRGMAHSNQIREFVITPEGIDLLDVYVGPAGVLTGSTRLSQEAQERAAAMVLDLEIEARQLGLERRRKAMEAQLSALQAEFKAEEEAVRRDIIIRKSQQQRLALEKQKMAQHRGADAESNGHQVLQEGSLSGHAS
jgi:circadian clock protein KaiC